MNTTNPAPGGTGQIDRSREEIARTQLANIQNEEKRRELAHARAMKAGIKTSEGVMTALIVIGAFAVPLGTVQLLFEQLAALHPAAPILATIATILGALRVAAGAVGAYAQSRAAVKTGLRMMALALVLGMTLTGTPALARDWTPVTADLPSTVAPADTSPLDSLSLGVSAGWSFERKALAVDLVGAVHVAEVQRWTLSIGFSGALLQALRELAAGSFTPSGLSGAIGLYALLPAPPGAGLRVGLAGLFEGTMSGKAGWGVRAAVFW